MVTGRRTREFRAGLTDPAAVQTRTLLDKVVGPNRTSEFGRAHGFQSVQTVADYRSAVPVRTFESFRPWVERMLHAEPNVLVSEPVRRFFITSGSTDVPKHIPVTSTFIRDKLRAFSLFWAFVFEGLPHLSGGRIVTNFSDTGEILQTPGGLPASSESAFWSRVTAATQRRQEPFVPPAVARTPDPEARYYAIARVLLERDFQVIMTLNPSTLLRLFEVINEYREPLIEDVANGGLGTELPVPAEAQAVIERRFTGNPTRAAALRKGHADEAPHLRSAGMWPNLELAVCWQSPMLRSYHRLLDPYLGEVVRHDYLCMASEGIIAIPMEPGKSGGVLATSIHFLELIPVEQIGREDPDVILPEEAEVGGSYVVVLSTSAGLYRYNIGDVVRVTGFVGGTPTVEFLHRVGRTCSLTGEKLTEDQVSLAVERISRDSALAIESFTMKPAPGGYPRYVLLVELAESIREDSLEALAKQLDEELARVNLEYASKRSSMRLHPPEVWLVREGSYRLWQERRVAEGAVEGQLKPTRLSRDPAYHDEFEIEARYDAD